MNRRVGTLAVLLALVMAAGGWRQDRRVAG